MAVAAVKQGAVDWLEKPCDEATLLAAVQRAASLSQALAAEAQRRAWFDRLFKGFYLPHVIEPSAGLDRMALAVIAKAFRPTISFGRPGKCTSPAEIIVVTPPFMVDSIHPNWFCRGVQSPKTG